jgi:uncharacterized membrane protein
VGKLQINLIILLVVTWLVIPPLATAQPPEDPVVRAILFYSPTCPHCHAVINELIIPMVEDYGSEQLQVIGIDTSQPAGGVVYQATIDRFEIPPPRQGVPTLVVGNTVLVGSVEIPEAFPELVEKGLNEGGIDWPDIPGLEQVIPPQISEESTPPPEVQPSTTPDPTTTTESETDQAITATPNASTPTPLPTTAPAVSLDEGELPLAETEEPPPDPVGFAIAGVLLLGMIAALVYAAWRLVAARQHLFELDRSLPSSAQTWAIPILALLGLGVALYLAYVEIVHVEAVCGPVGECNIVQSSPYAQILGIPIAVLGTLNYLGVIVLWAIQKYASGRLVNVSALGLLGLTLFGTLFSIYLTCLELFVIRAVCAWCLSSAAITTILMLLVAIPITGKES